MQESFREIAQQPSKIVIIVRMVRPLRGRVFYSLHLLRTSDSAVAFDKCGHLDTVDITVVEIACVTWHLAQFLPH